MSKHISQNKKLDSTPFIGLRENQYTHHLFKQSLCLHIWGEGNVWAIRILSPPGCSNTYLCFKNCKIAVYVICTMMCTKVRVLYKPFKRTEKLNYPI